MGDVGFVGELGFRLDLRNFQHGYPIDVVTGMAE
jgi:hypothetical protein